jgi:hypothetical protein
MCGRFPEGPRATSCVLRAAACSSLLPNPPLRPPTSSHLTLSLASPSSSAALLPHPSVPLLFCCRTSVHCLSLRCRLPQPCCRALQLRPVLFPLSYRRAGPPCGAPLHGELLSCLLALLFSSLLSYRRAGPTRRDHLAVPCYLARYFLLLELPLP